MESRLLGFRAAEHRSLALRGGSWAREPSCSNTGTVSGQYKKNLDELLSNLSKAAPENGVFCSSTVGTGADRVHGSLMCFVDHDQTKCHDCLANTTAWITKTCPNSRTASASYGACLLQYLSPPFVGSDMNIIFMSFSPPLDGDTASMSNARSRLFEEISHKASNQTLGFYFQSRRYTAGKQMMRVYGLAQCRGDLAPGGCSRCISGYNGMLRQFFPNNDGGIVKGHSCYVRFQPSKIIIFGEAIPPPPPYFPPQGLYLPLPPSSSHLRDQDSPLVAGAVVILMVSMMAALWWFCRRAMAHFFPTRQQSLPVQNVQLTSTNLDSLPGVNLPAREHTPVPTEHLETGLMEFSYQEMETATGGFSKELGKGGFAKVYEGKIGDLMVAIKKLTNASVPSVDGFKNEVATLSSLKHKNVLQLIGWCHDNDNWLLVYELMPRGSLEGLLYRANAVLPWFRRYQIALGLAHALAYIHEDSSDRRFVIHKDIKPENIMIGEDFNPKLGDFGLAKFFNHGQSATMESPFGTFGYADPFSDGIPSFRSDMFSFGVVLLVIGSGQPAILGEDVDVIIPHIKYLVMRDYESGRITDVADPRLQGNFVTEEMDAIIRVGLLCVSKKLHERPLANLVTTWLESRTGKNIPDHTDGGPPLYFNSEASSDNSEGETSTPLLGYPFRNVSNDPNSDRSTAALNNGRSSAAIRKREMVRRGKRKVGNEDSSEGTMSSALLDSLSSAAIQYPDSDRSTTAPKQNFSYQELVSATKNFSTKLGGFGGVYEGIIDGTKVAIKMLSHASELSVEGYKAEVTTLGHLNHPNVVQLIGWCHHQKYVLLVYELMPNGSLDALLHRDKPVLPWFRRYEIALGLARALEYIHEDSNGSGLVIHKNIKPRNIMIDESFNAKLGDFGLANFTNHALVPELVPPALLTGYMDRESYGRPSVQADMFGFGVVLLVMGSGRHPVEFAKEDDGSLTVVDKPPIRDLVLMDYKRGGVQAAADPRLKDFVSDEMKTMLRVGLLCVSTDLEKRPAARDVLKWLESPKSWKNMPDPMNGGSVSVSSVELPTLKKTVVDMALHLVHGATGQGDFESLKKTKAEELIKLIEEKKNL